MSHETGAPQNNRTRLSGDKEKDCAGTGGLHENGHTMRSLPKHTQHLTDASLPTEAQPMAEEAQPCNNKQSPFADAMAHWVKAKRNRESAEHKRSIKRKR